jgi:5-methylthioadenosine/S-adenosylhomocysteine deaminase
VLVAGRPVVRKRKLVTIDEAKLAAEAGEISPEFRREVAAQIKRSDDLVKPLLEGNRAVWQTELGIARYIGGPRNS